MDSVGKSNTKQLTVFLIMHMIKSTFGLILSVMQIIVHLIKSNSVISARHIFWLRKTGLVTIANFMSMKECEVLSSQVLLACSEGLEISISDSDLRLFNAEKTIVSLHDFYSNNIVRNIGASYLGLPIKNSGTMANVVPAGKNTNGSGGSWHRDSNFPQYKALVYLSDGDLDEDGAFQYIPKSNRMKYILREIRQTKRSISDTRWTNDELVTFEKSPPISVTGKAGTLVLFETSLLHRGSPNFNNFLKSRVAITNYYYPIIGSIGHDYAN